MATIAGALTAKLIEEFKLPEHEGRVPLRPLYIATALFDWIDETDELYEENWSNKTGGRSRFEHLMQTFSDFRCDVRPLVGDLKRVTPTKKGVWKIHSQGLRIYGWVPFPHSFVAVKAAFNDQVHGHGSITDQMVGAVIEFAKDNHLAETIKRGDIIALFPPTTR